MLNERDFWKLVGNCDRLVVPTYLCIGRGNRFDHIRDLVRLYFLSQCQSLTQNRFHFALVT